MSDSEAAAAAAAQAAASEGEEAAAASKAEAPSVPKEKFRIHVRLGALEPRGSFGLHIWGPAAAAATAWGAPQAAAGEDWFGPFFDVALALNSAVGELKVEGGPAMGVLLHNGDDKRACHEFSAVADVPADGAELWLGLGGGPQTEAPAATALPCGDLASGGARAHWLQKDVLAWRSAGGAPSESSFWLYSSTAAALQDGGTEGVQHFDSQHALALKARQLTPELAERHPYLKDCALLEVPRDVDARALCRCQLAVAAVSAAGECLDCTGVQVGSLLDDLFSYSGPLGCTPAAAPGGIVSGIVRLFSGLLHHDAHRPEEEEVSLTLWAPTAQEVSAIFYDGAQGPETEVLPMEFDSAGGIWHLRGPAAWWGRYYKYRIKAYHPQPCKVVVMESPDPYSSACSADSDRSLARHLPTWDEVAPGGSVAAWKEHTPPAFQDRGSASVYELHIRDFSACDEAVPDDKRGKYVAFELEGTCGDRHLRRLAEAGLTHVQLLPNYDFGSVPERASNRKEPVIPEGEAPDSELPQRLVTEVQDQDSFNWGYDPVLYNVPEGSYATDPDGGARILEHRRMIQALHAKGLRVVVDVVYNHTLGSGPEGPHSILDKCVPGYYHRRSESGAYENSTCMNNTASEHAMMERLIVDSVLHWAKEYRVDGFRFDLMGHLTLQSVMAVRHALDALTVKEHGIDGKNILMYGEGWEFGEVAGDQRGPVAVQRRLAGSGVGSFNDRVRDAAVGGSPFGDPRIQGFCTGLLHRPWPESAGVEQGDEERQQKDLLVAADKLRVALAASLQDYVLAEDCEGNKDVTAGSIHGGGVGYTGSPQEIVNYVSAHDNETLFDNTVWKMSPALFSPEERQRANWLLTSIVAFSHGIPFFHAGDELLRSKSLDRDSYNSGDWFNVLDFSGKRNAFGTGLPVKSKNGEKWDMLRDLLKDKAVKPTAEQAAASTAKLCELLRTRKSTPLLALTDAQDVFGKVDFPGCGKDQIPGIIVMQVCNGAPAAAPAGPNLCGKFARVVVVISGRLDETRVPIPAALAPRSRGAGAPATEGKLCAVGVRPLELHPVQAASEDAVLRGAKVGEELIVPALTAAVFVEPLP